MADLHKLLGDQADIILKDLGVGEMNESDKNEVMQQLIQHFQKVILETVVVSLDKEHLQAFKDIMEGPEDQIEDKMMVLTATVPGLAEKIQQAIHDEFTVVKAAYAKLS